MGNIPWSGSYDRLIGRREQLALAKSRDSKKEQTTKSKESKQHTANNKGQREQTKSRDSKQEQTTKSRESIQELTIQKRKDRSISSTEARPADYPD
jgi:hypothetical protein